MSKVTLDAETFRALASSTRLNVLRALDERRKTLSELSRGLDLNKATLHEHLQLLSAADLVRKRDDEGRKWIYYELTWRGQRLLHPQETTTFNVLLGLGVLAAGGGVGILGKALGWWLQERSLDGGMDAFGDSESLRNQSSAAAEDTAAASPASGGSTATGSATTASQAPATSPSAAPSASSQSAPAGAGQDDVMALEDAQGGASKAASTEGSGWDDDGWIGIALLACTTLFGILAWRLRKKIQPGRFVAPAADDEGSS